MWDSRRSQRDTGKLGGDGYIHHLDRGDGFMGAQVPDASDCILEICVVFLYVSCTSVKLGGRVVEGCARFFKIYFYQIWQRKLCSFYYPA